MRRKWVILFNALPLTAITLAARSGPQGAARPIGPPGVPVPEGPQDHPGTTGSSGGVTPAEIKTHVFSINPFQIAQFDEAGYLPTQQISLGFAPRNCHVEGTSMAKTDQESIDMAVDYHKRQ
jgi:hypothetical protein